MPLMLAEDVGGEFVRVLSQVITLTPLASWAIAITIMPAICFGMIPQAMKAATAATPVHGVATRLYGLLALAAPILPAFCRCDVAIGGRGPRRA
jgi:multidrug efflux pump subunit AcrB